MKLNRIFCFLSFLFVVMSAGNAFAVLFELPNSSFQGGAWNGESTYSDNGFQAVVQYAVYDKLGGNEWGGKGYDAPGDGRYIYAYQVFNYNSNTNKVGYLKLFGAAGHTLTGGEMSGIGSQKDPTDTQFPEQGIKPFSGEFDDTEKQISWKFLDAGGDFGLIGQAQHSYFLIFSSNNAPVMGNYEIKQSQSGGPTPGQDSAPEPATIVLFGTGGLILLRKLRKSI
ncbi:MAG: PEP-CTERM sorting domain-containing protein [Planctomycetota bacterium]|nr:PEP-CTERM sorting domain-containing protein [Planctomycetota bacterium]